MARYVVVDISSRLLPRDIPVQLVTDSLARASSLVDLSALDAHCRDETGTSAMLLKSMLQRQRESMNG
jgi:hypothetical protein